MFEFMAIGLYFALVLTIGVVSYTKSVSNSDFILGNRSLNYWLTAIAAHASDMSSWLFMAYPAMIFAFGLNKIWIAVGLIACMFCNWQYIAPKLRVATEASNSLTFFSYIGSRFNDRSGLLRVVTALICLVFYTVYISTGLIGLGLLVESLFHISYSWAVLISILIALPYVMIGGYKTLAWIDLFQGLFLMLIIAFVPLYLMGHVGGWEGIKAAAISQNFLSIVPDFSLKGVGSIFLIMLGWGLGYFGQPAIITKFMGIKNPSEIHKSKYIGMSWMIISMAAATLVGLVAIPFFKGGIANNEMIFVNLVQSSFHPFLIGLILCAVFAASINVICSQILVVCSSFTEDIYRRIFRPEAKSSELLLVSRGGVVFVTLIAFVIAFFKINTIYALVLYAWSGLGSSFGPLLIYSLYSKRASKQVAWSAILTGSLASAIWPYFNKQLGLEIDPIIVGFSLSFLAIFVTSRFVKAPVLEQA